MDSSIKFSPGKGLEMTKWVGISREETIQEVSTHQQDSIEALWKGKNEKRANQ